MYEPKPIDTRGIRLSPKLTALVEELARHNHDLWAQQRLREGWSYGPRNDALKQNPCLVPYEDLPESEKDYDRNAAEGIIKAILSRGYDIAQLSQSVPRPVPTVRVIVPDPQKQVLILKRSANTMAGNLWCLPGGKVEYGETLEQAVMRELTEETSLHCNSLRFLFYQDSPPLEEGGMHCINLYFECQVTGDLKLSDESSEHVWMRPAEFKHYAFTFRNDMGLMRYWEDHVEP